MNILILNWRDIKHPLAGGAETSLWEQAKYWQKKGANITWFSSSFENSKPQEMIDGISVIRRGSHFTVHLLAFIYFQKHRNSDETIIIDSFHFLPFFTPFYFKKQKKIALINETAREVWFKNLSLPFSWIGYHLEEHFFRFYKTIPFITGSQSAKDDVIKFGIPAKNIEIVHHGFTKFHVDSSIKKEKTPTLLFLSRLTKDKGIEDAIEAASLVMKEVPSLRFWVGGKAENEGYYSYLKNIVEKKGLKPRTTFFGFVTDEEKFELFTKAWFVIHPSIKEGWGLTVIEANSCATPVVGYSVAGLKDSIVDQKTGILTSKNTPEALAKGISELIRDPNLLHKLSVNAKKWSEQFDWEVAGKNSWHILQSVYEKK